MVNVSPATTKRAGLFSPARLAADYAYVMPGFFISLFAFVILIPLTALSLGTLVIWIGALLLPLTLTIASGFAELSRTRLRHWGVEPPAVRYTSSGQGLSGLMRRMLEPRRWLDLVFETVVALPLRTFTFVVATTWSACALAGVTFLFWGVFLPDRGLSYSPGQELPLPGLILEAMTAGAAPDWLTGSFVLEVGFNLVVGIVFLLTLPLVMRGLARLDAAATAAGLGAAPSGTRGSSAVDPERPDEPASRTGHESTGGGAGSGVRPGAPPGPVFPEHGRSGGRLGQFVSGEGWAWIGAAAISVVTIAVGWPMLAAVYGMPVLFAMLSALASAAALLLVVRWPLPGIAVQTVSMVATTLLTAGTFALPWPWPVELLILQAFLVLFVALRHPWPWAVAAWAAPQAAVLAATTALGLTTGARDSLIVSASVSLGLLALGAVIRQLVRSRGALREERRTSADLSAQRQELAERNRIAQELHDVVAHSMSVISVQATTAKYRLPEMDPASAQEFQSIADSSRRALTEMRGLLAILRSRNHEAPLAPQPVLEDIPELVEATRRSGASISFRSNVDEGDAAVPSATALTAYRIVQEALSNAVRHAPGSEVDVVVAVADDRVTVDVSNGPATGAEAHQSAPGAGLGLAGVRERTAALGGTVEAGPVDEGGFRVRAELPLG